MKQKLKILKNNLCSILAKVIDNHKKFIIIFAILFLIGFITGIFTAGEYAQDLTCENLINKYLYSLLTNDANYLSFFLTMAVFFVILVVATAFCIRNKLMIVLFSIILMLGAYIYGFDLCVIFVTLGLSGIIIGFISIGIIGLIVAFFYILIFSIACNKCLDKTNINNRCNLAIYFKLYLLLVMLSIIALFLLCFIFNVIHIFVIVE